MLNKVKSALGGKRIIFLIMVLFAFANLATAQEPTVNAKPNGSYLTVAGIPIDKPVNNFTAHYWGFNKLEYTFSAGDTTTTFTVSSAKSVYFTAIDSSMTGTDSLYLALKVAYSNSVAQYVAFSVHLLGTTTSTTQIASTLLIPGASGASTWVWYPGGISGTQNEFTGTFFMSRLNGVNASTPYLPKSRIIVWYE